MSVAVTITNENINVEVSPNEIIEVDIAMEGPQGVPGSPGTQISSLDDIPNGVNRKWLTAEQLTQLELIIQSFFTP